jgi:phospholipase C
MSFTQGGALSAAVCSTLILLAACGSSAEEGSGGDSPHGSNDSGPSGQAGSAGSGGSSMAMGGLDSGSMATSDANTSSDGAAAMEASPVMCPSPVSVDSKAAMRKACMFKLGDMPSDTVEVKAGAKLPIDHVIVMMKENRSFDQHLGKLSLHGQKDAEPLPDTFTNLDAKGAAVAPFHLTTTCIKTDPPHSFAALHNAVNVDKMDGFVKGATTASSDGHYVMGYYDDTDLPFYYFLANTFAVGDHNFSSVRGSTWPNRDYLLVATSDGVKDTGGGHPAANLPTIMDELDKKGVTWGAYTPSTPFEECLGWAANHVGVHNQAAFKAALADGTLPAVSFIDSREGIEDEHPTADVQVGEAWSRDIYQAVIASKIWPTTALILTYDEAGGFADHVPPPNACPARPQDSAFFELGVRVPLIVISPYARRHYVSHVVHEHTSITRFIETVFDLPALTARDANSDALLDMFDFACPGDPQIPAAPAAGTKGCN